MKNRIFIKELLAQESREFEEILQNSSKTFEEIFHNSTPELKIKLLNLATANASNSQANTAYSQANAANASNTSNSKANASSNAANASNTAHQSSNASSYLFTALMEEKDLERISTFICLHPYDQDCLLLGLAGALGIKSTNLRIVQQAKEYLTKALIIDSGYASYLSLLASVSTPEEMKALLENLKENIYVLRYKYEYSKSLEIAVKIWNIDPLWNLKLLVKETRGSIQNSRNGNLSKMMDIIGNRIEILPFDSYDLWDCWFEGLELLDDVEEYLKPRSWWPEYLENSSVNDKEFTLAERFRSIVQETVDDE